MSTLLARLAAKIGPPGRFGCRKWTGGVSQSGWRGVFYGIIREDAPDGRVLRVNRVMLMLKTGPLDCPRDGDEPLRDWLRRLESQYRPYEASHTCDDAMCASADHLTWKDHGANVREQAERRRHPPTPVRFDRRRSIHDAIINDAIAELRAQRDAAFTRQEPAWEDDD